MVSPGSDYKPAGVVLRLRYPHKTKKTRLIMNSDEVRFINGAADSVRTYV